MMDTVDKQPINENTCQDTRRPSIGSHNPKKPTSNEKLHPTQREDTQKEESLKSFPLDTTQRAENSSPDTETSAPPTKDRNMPHVKKPVSEVGPFNGSFILFIV